MDHISTTTGTTTILTTHESAVIHYIQMLDIDMIDTLLETGRTYQDMDKDVFIRKLGYALDEFLNSGDTHLTCKSGQCNTEMCNYRCRGYSFTGNNSGKHMDLIIEKNEEGRVLDIYECLFFLCDGMRTTNSYRTRVKIDIV
jgi:hypothetical protein